VLVRLIYENKLSTHSNKYFELLRNTRGINMVNSLSITFMWVSAFISFLFPIILLVYFRRRDKISYKVLAVGALTFIVFSQVFEKILHVVVINNNLFPNPIAFGIYGAFAAGIFEEIGRFAFIKLFLKKHTAWKDGIAFGVGHGGIEAILIGVIANVQNIAYAMLINSGTFDQILLAQVGNNEAAKQSILQLKNTLVNTAPTMFSLGWIERVFAVTLHIGFTMLILYAVKYRKNMYLLIAVLAHTFIDFFPALYQAKVLSLIQVELVLALFFIATIVFLFKFKAIFNRTPENQK
jgi:uncharacterized membrane protein YhfC